MKKICLLASIVLLVIVFLGYQFMTKDNALQARQAEIHEKGILVMPFDLDKTTHHFKQTEDGGVMEIRVKNPDDEEQINLIRQHLKKELDLFASGDFQDPSSLHGADMPGLATLGSSADKFSVEYSDLPDGAQLTYISDDQDVVAAFHQWFMAQMTDHGADAMGY